MGRIYSVSFAAVTFASDTPAAVALPAGMVCVLRDLEAATDGTGTYVACTEADSSVAYALTDLPIAFPAGNYGQWTGRVVLPDSAGLMLVTDGDYASVSLSGYALSP